MTSHVDEYRKSNSRMWLIPVFGMRQHKFGKGFDFYKFTHTLFVCVYFSSASRP